MNKIKRIVALALAVVMIFTLSACDLLGDSLGMFESLASASDLLDQMGGLDQISMDDIAAMMPDGIEPTGNVDYDGDKTPTSGITLDELKAQLNEARKNDTRTNLSGSDQYLPDYESAAFKAIEFTDEELAALSKAHGGVAQITAKQAQEDIDTLQRIFKTAYAPYEYFGGDEVFDKAFDNMRAAVSSASSNNISTTVFNDMIVKNLDFIVDSHLTIGNESMEFEEKVYYYDRDKTEFSHNDKGYYTNVQGRDFYLNPEYNDYMRLTVGKTGELVYTFIAMSGEKDNSDLPRTFKLTAEDGTTATYTIKWETDRYPYAYDLTWNENVGGVPMTGIGAMMVDNDYCISLMNDFVNHAKDLKNEDAIILDLRGNMGGLSTISYMWLYNLTGGKEVEGEYSMVYYMSKLNSFVTDGNNEEIIDALKKFDFFTENPDQLDELLNEEEDKPGEAYVYDTEDMWVERPNTVFVLCDKAVSSAGEMFIMQMMDVENVVVFGTNSNGCLISGGTNYYVPIYLPNSGLRVYYSTVLMMTDDPNDFDKVGVQPDVIVCGEDEAEAAARCWNFYN